MAKKFYEAQWKTDFLRTQLQRELSRKVPSPLALDYYSGKISYTDYLKSEHWRGIRKLKLEECGNACEVCGEDGVRLDIHHKNYETLGHESLDDLAALCPYCHKDVHDVITSLKGKDFKQKVHAIAVEYYATNVVKRTVERVEKSNKLLNNRVSNRTPTTKPKRRTTNEQMDRNKSRRKKVRSNRRYESKATTNL
jgi:hypothetical protein